MLLCQADKPNEAVSFAKVKIAKRERDSRLAAEKKKALSGVKDVQDNGLSQQTSEGFYKRLKTCSKEVSKRNTLI